MSHRRWPRVTPSIALRPSMKSRAIDGGDEGDRVLKRRARSAARVGHGGGPPRVAHVRAGSPHSHRSKEQTEPVRVRMPSPVRGIRAPQSRRGRRTRE